jgi:hypothetical protein
MLFEAAEFALFPMLFVARTTNVYAVPVVKPVTVIVPEPACESVPVTPPGDDVAVYEVIVCPPLLAGAVKATVAVVDPVVVAVPIVGAPGTDHVVMLLDAAELAPVPTLFVALTTNVYAVPVVRPVTVIVPEPACESVPVPPAGDDVAVYDVIAVPPLLAG